MWASPDALFVSNKIHAIVSCMKILAIETSCDETAIAIAEFFGTKKRPKINVLSNIISSQVKLHAKFGGVVPNLARREHQKNLVPILLRALKKAALLKRYSSSNVEKIHNESSRQARTIFEVENILEREPELLKQFKKYVLPLPSPYIDAISVTYGPGLAPALWVGVNFAKALAYLWGKPLIPVNHMAGHLYSAFLQKGGIKNYQLSVISYPALALLVSGGHTELVLMRGHGKYKILGETLDDAAGEAFDKVARILGLGYPGGPEIAHLARRGDPKKHQLPSPMINSKDYNFSFSGLKTAVLYLLRDTPRASKKDVAASFQKAAVDVLIAKTVRAAKEYKIKTVLLGGGVAANKLLRKRLGIEIDRSLPATTYQLPALFMTGDNALMVALAAYFSGKKRALDNVGADANVKL